MFCGKCGTPNDETNNNCVNCGAPLRRQPDSGYAQPQPPYGNGYAQPQMDYDYTMAADGGYAQPPYNGYAQPPYNGYPQPAAAPVGKKPTVLYVIAGVMAVLMIALLLLPQFTYKNSYVSGAYNIFGFAAFGRDVYQTLGSSSQNVQETANSLSIFCIALFVIPLIMSLVWGLLSFLRVRAAGIFGVITAAFMMIADIIWMTLIAVFVSAAAGTSSEVVTMTPFPILVLLLAIAALPVSIIQIVKKKYL